MFGLIDAESVEAQEDARALPWEKAFAEFARSERIKTRPFHYASLSRSPAYEYKRERKLLAKRPWRDFGRCWPYCIEHARGVDPHLWVPKGREYQPIGCDQFSRGPYPYEAEASSAWRFSNCDPLAIEGVWPRTPGYLYNDSLDSRRGYFERFGRLISYADDPVECGRRLMLAWRRACPLPPSPYGTKPRRDAPSSGGVAVRPLPGALAAA